MSEERGSPVDHAVAIALGSNLGDRLANLRFGVRRLQRILEDLCCSGVYETEPQGLADQPLFLNACCAGRTRLSARQLLAELQDAERAAGRRRGVRNGPRELDLDILLYGEAVIDDPLLVVPHPRLALRAFVLAPLEEIAAEWVVPGMPDGAGVTVGDLAGAVPHAGIERTDMQL
jgi:2-amino-4-hydroxy-6-hydroxymethyldihydropteridine diphosphokinase